MKTSVNPYAPQKCHSEVEDNETSMVGDFTSWKHQVNKRMKENKTNGSNFKAQISSFCCLRTAKQPRLNKNVEKNGFKVFGLNLDGFDTSFLWIRAYMTIFCIIVSQFGWTTSIYVYSSYHFKKLLTILKISIIFVHAWDENFTFN